MGHNSFFSNAEAYALEILQQKFIKDAQRSAQQSFWELSALRSLFNQGQFMYCIPLGGMGFPGCPLPNYSLNSFQCPDSFFPPPPYYTPSPQPLSISLGDSSNSSNSSNTSTIPTPCSSSTPTSTTSTSPVSSIVHVNVKNGYPRHSNRPGSDECNIGKDGIEIVIDLKDYLPAEIFLNAEEKTVEVRANHSTSQGSKTFSRKYELPACIILDSVKCILSHDGFLMFSAAWCKME